MTEKEYKDAMKALKARKPNSMNKDSWKGFDNVGAALRAWNKDLQALKSKNPSKYGFTYSQEKGLSYEKLPTTEPKTQPKTETKTETKTEPKAQPKAEPKKDKPATKEADKINKDLASVKQKGASSFLRSLLPSKDRLSPSQRMAKAGKSKGQILRKRLGK